MKNMKRNYVAPEIKEIYTIDVEDVVRTSPTILGNGVKEDDVQWSDYWTSK